MKKLMFLSILLIATSLSHAQYVWHVDSANGSNSNSGLSKAAALETVSAALDSVADGSRIGIIRVYAGSYTENFTTITSGTATQQMIIEAVGTVKLTLATPGTGAIFSLASKSYVTIDGFRFYVPTSGQKAVDVASSSNCKVLNNYAWGHTGSRLIYSFAAAVTNIEVAGNSCYEIANGFYLSNSLSASGINVYHNTFDVNATDGHAIRIAASSGAQTYSGTVKNNICSYGKNGITFETGVFTNMVVEYNNSYNLTANYTGFTASATNSTVDPQFISPTDLRLKKTSPMIGASDIGLDLGYWQRSTAQFGGE